MPRKRAAAAPKWPLYPKWGGAKPDKDDCPRCGQDWWNTRIFSRGSCILCAIDAGEVDVPDDLKAKGWKLMRSSYHCIAAVRTCDRIGVPLYDTFRLDACIAQAQGYQFAWEWLHEGGAGYVWGAFHAAGMTRSGLISCHRRSWSSWWLRRYNWRTIAAPQRPWSAFTPPDVFSPNVRAKAQQHSPPFRPAHSSRRGFYE